MRRILSAICCLAILGAAGCAELCDSLPTWVPFCGPISDSLPGVPTPAQRIATLRKLALEVSRHTPEEQQQITEELATAIRTEQDALIRAEIVHTLGVYPGAAADRVLKAALSDPDADVRIAACQAAAHRKSDELTKAMIGQLNGDTSGEVRMATARALGERKDPAAVPALGTALEDPDPAMQYRAMVALRQITGKDFGNDVNQWRQYVKGETPKPAKPVSLADRFRHMF
jgi:HEAT repeat protein